MSWHIFFFPRQWCSQGRAKRGPLPPVIIVGHPTASPPPPPHSWITAPFASAPLSLVCCMYIICLSFLTTTPSLLLTGSHTTQNPPSLKAGLKKKQKNHGLNTTSHLYVWNCRNGPLIFISQQDVCEQFPVREGKCSTFPKNSPCLPLHKTDASNWPVKKKRKEKKKMLLMFWLIIDQSRTPPPALHLWHKCHTSLLFFFFFFFSGQWHTPARLRDTDVTLFIISYWEAMREWIHLRGSLAVAPQTAFPPPRPLRGVPGEVSIKQAQCLGHFNPSPTSFISAPTPLEPRQWKSASVDKTISLFTLCTCLLYGD